MEALMLKNRKSQSYRANKLLKLIKKEQAKGKEIWFMNVYVRTDIKTIMLELSEIEKELEKLGGLEDHEVKVVAGTARNLAEMGKESFVLFKTIQFEKVTDKTLEKLADEAKSK